MARPTGTRNFLVSDGKVKESGPVGRVVGNIGGNFLPDARLECSLHCRLVGKIRLKDAEGRRAGAQRRRVGKGAGFQTGKLLR
jgi:hypothetical protein